jgi:hypothetical protein
VGEGSGRSAAGAIGLGGHPLGVDIGEGGEVRLAARGGLTLVVTGVEGPAMDPEAVRFLDLGVLHSSLEALCGANGRPNSAAVNGYPAFLSRTAAQISASCASARLSLSTVSSTPRLLCGRLWRLSPECILEGGVPVPVSFLVYPGVVFELVCCG